MRRGRSYLIMSTITTRDGVEIFYKNSNLANV